MCKLRSAAAEGGFAWNVAVPGTGMHRCCEQGWGWEMVGGEGNAAGRREGPAARRWVTLFDLPCCLTSRSGVLLLRYL